MEKQFDLLALGEILLRLSPPNNERIVRGDLFEKQVGGAELNVVSRRIPSGPADGHDFRTSGQCPGNLRQE